MRADKIKRSLWTSDLWSVLAMTIKVILFD